MGLCLQPLYIPSSQTMRFIIIIIIIMYIRSIEFERCISNVRWLGYVRSGSCFETTSSLAKDLLWTANGPPRHDLILNLTVEVYMLPYPFTFDIILCWLFFFLMILCHFNIVVNFVFENISPSFYMLLVMDLQITGVNVFPVILHVLRTNRLTKSLTSLFFPKEILLSFSLGLYRFSFFYLSSDLL